MVKPLYSFFLGGLDVFLWDKICEFKSAILVIFVSFKIQQAAAFLHKIYLFRMLPFFLFAIKNLFVFQELKT